MIAILWIWNFAISWLNAWGCGKTWTESRVAGGMPHFLNWMGAIMSASGFTWCYLLVLGWFGASIPFEQDDGSSAPYLTQEMLDVFLDLGYLVVVFPIIGSGLAITVHSWGVFWRRRSIGDGALALYNSYAEFHNVVGALRHVPSAWDNVAGLFSGGSSSSSDSKGKGGLIVVLLVAVAALGGVLTTAAIIRSVARNTAQARSHREDFAEEFAG